MHQRFVLISSQRSGSNMLRSLLDAHPDITCFGELMRQSPNGTRQRLRHMLQSFLGRATSDVRPTGYRGALRTLEHVDPKFRSDRVRFANPHEFVDEVMEKLATTPVAGFKLMLNQHPRFLHELILEPAYAKILLYRANYLAAFSSQEIARVTGQGAARGRAEIKHAKVKFDKRAFRHFMESRERLFARARTQLAKSGAKHLEIEYLDLVDGNGLADILKFLEVDPAHDLAPKTLKRNPSNLLDRFHDPAEVEKTLAEMGLEEWAVEKKVLNSLA